MNEMCLELPLSQESVFAPYKHLNSSNYNNSSRPATSSSLVEEKANFERARGGQHLTITESPHMAYMVNYNFDVVWFNRKAQTDLPGLFEHLPHGNEDRSIFKLLLRRDENEFTQAMLEMSVALAKERMPLERILQPLRGMPSSALQKFKRIYAQVQGRPGNSMVELPPQPCLPGNKLLNLSVHATYFREGILIVLTEQHDFADDLQRLLERRDVVIRTLLAHQLPALTAHRKQGMRQFLRLFAGGLKLQVRLMTNFLIRINCLKKLMGHAVIQEPTRIC